jgi:hypothetical protein
MYNTYTHTHTIYIYAYMYIYVYIYIYCVCVCVCVCAYYMYICIHTCMDVYICLLSSDLIFFFDPFFPNKKDIHVACG